MAPEDDVIDSSSLTKFRRLRLQDVSLLDMLIGKTVEIALEKKHYQKVKQSLWTQRIPKHVITKKSPKEFFTREIKTYPQSSVSIR